MCGSRRASNGAEVTWPKRQTISPDGPTLSDAEWVALHVPRLAAIRPRYLAYADFLQAVLKHGCGKLAPLALIETRAKSIPSFAEKILRKRTAYMQPKGSLPADPLAATDRSLRRPRHRANLRSGPRRVPVRRGGVRNRFAQQRRRQPAAAAHGVRLSFGPLHRVGRSGKAPGRRRHAADSAGSSSV